MQMAKFSRFSTGRSCAAAVIAIGLGIGPVQSQSSAAPAPAPEFFEYAVKFVCGRPSDQRPVASGFYFTVINVHNPNNEAIKFGKKFVLALINQKQSKSTKLFTEEFGPDFAFAVECAEIMKRLGVTGFATGFVIFQSAREMDIVAVYTTASAPGGPVTTFHTERVPKRP